MCDIVAVNPSLRESLRAYICKAHIEFYIIKLNKTCHSQLRIQHVLGLVHSHLALLETLLENGITKMLLPLYNSYLIMFGASVNVAFAFL